MVRVPFQNLMMAALVLALAAAVYSGRDLPILIRDPATGVHATTAAFEHNRFRVDTLFSYQPTPGTVFFADYSSVLTEPQGLRFDRLRRTGGGFFLKVSYLFRL